MFLAQPLYRAYWESSWRRAAPIPDPRCGREFPQYTARQPQTGNDGRPVEAFRRPSRLRILHKPVRRKEARRPSRQSQHSATILFSTEVAWTNPGRLTSDPHRHQHVLGAVFSLGIFRAKLAGGLGVFEFQAHLAFVAQGLQEIKNVIGIEADGDSLAGV